MDIREKLLLLQKISGLTQTELARRLGVTFAALNRWINKKALPRKSAEVKINTLYIEYSGEKQIPQSVLAGKKYLLVQKKKQYPNPLKNILQYPDIHDAFVLALTYHSNRIEGSTLSEGETADVLFRGASLPHKSLSEQIEVKNHQTALEYLFEYLFQKKSIDEKLILKIHAILMNSVRSDAGEYRRHGVRIVGSYVPTVNHLKISDMMSTLVKDIRQKPKDMIDFLAHTHARFEQIHPFSDGNGRVGRLLMTALALRSGLPPVVIREEKRKFYLLYLNTAQLKDSYDQLEDFIYDSLSDGYAILERKN